MGVEFIQTCSCLASISETDNLVGEADFSFSCSGSLGIGGIVAGWDDFWQGGSI